MIVAGLIGCRRGETDARLLSDMKPSDTVAIVNGDRITRADMLRLLDFESALNRSINEQITKGSRISEKDLMEAVKDYRNHRERTVIPEMINTVLVAQEVRKAGISASADEVRRIEREFLKSFPGVKSIKALSMRLKLDFDYFRSRMEAQARQTALLKTLYKDLFAITTNDLADVRAKQRAHNGNVVATNALQRTRAVAIMEEIKGGLSFEKAAAKYSEVNPEEGENPRDFLRSELDGMPLRNWAFSAKEGDIGGPFEQPDGISIYKLLMRTEGADDFSFAAEQVAQVRLLRITLHLYEEVPLPETDEALTEFIRESRLEYAMKQLLMRLHGEMRLEWPHGTNFWDSAAVSAEKPKEKNNEQK